MKDIHLPPLEDLTPEPEDTGYRPAGTVTPKETPRSQFVPPVFRSPDAIALPTMKEEGRTRKKADEPRPAERITSSPWQSMAGPAKRENIFRGRRGRRKETRRNERNRNLSPDGKHKWMVFLLVVLVQLGVLSYIGWRWHKHQRRRHPVSVAMPAEAGRIILRHGLRARRIPGRHDYVDGRVGSGRRRKNIRPYFP